MEHIFGRFLVSRPLGTQATSPEPQPSSRNLWFLIFFWQSISFICNAAVVASCQISVFLLDSSQNFVIHRSYKLCRHFNLLSGCPTATFGPLLRGKPHYHWIFINIQSKGHQESCSKVGSQGLAKCTVWFEPGIF